MRAGWWRRSAPAPTVVEPVIDPDRANVRYWDDAAFGPVWRCEAGQVAKPVGCEYHHSHFWCDTCAGYYGVPHEGIHEPGIGQHPRGGIESMQCACRPCKVRSGREEARA